MVKVVSFGKEVAENKQGKLQESFYCLYVIKYHLKIGHLTALPLKARLEIASAAQTRTGTLPLLVKFGRVSLALGQKECILMSQIRNSM